MDGGETGTVSTGAGGTTGTVSIGGAGGVVELFGGRLTGGAGVTGVVIAVSGPIKRESGSGCGDVEDFVVSFTVISTGPKGLGAKSLPQPAKTIIIKKHSKRFIL